VLGIKVLTLNAQLSLLNGKGEGFLIGLKFNPIKNLRFFVKQFIKSAANPCKCGISQQSLPFK